jgi:hypothetical protein
MLAEQMFQFLPLICWREEYNVFFFFFLVNAVEIFVLVNYTAPLRSHRRGSDFLRAAHKGYLITERNTTQSQPSLSNNDEPLHPITVIQRK